jgi:hypothetical protein
MGTTYSHLIVVLLSLPLFMFCLVPSNMGAYIDNSKFDGGAYHESEGSHGASL